MSRKFSFLLILAVCALMLASVPAGLAQEDGTTDRPAVTFTAGQAVTPRADYSASGLAPRPTSGLVTAMIQLNGRGAAEALAYQSRSARAANLDAANRVANIEAAQSNFTTTLRQQIPGVTVVGNTRWLSNSVIVNVDASHLDAIEALPGVARVYLDEAAELTHGDSVEFVGAPTAWTSVVDGATGAGVRVGIVDSGLDYFHANFGGDGDPADHAADDRSIIEEGTFPTDRVLGGYDFVGEGWTFPLALNPDADPNACADTTPGGGHGTHVAGSAVGNGVTDTNVAFTGPFDGTVPFDTLTIAPGVAPEADIYALKVGDCTTSVSAVGALQAWDWALDPNGDGNPDDRLHVLNNSWGGAFASLEDLVVQQANLAVAADVMIVFSAGNRGEVYYIQDTVPDGGITVASIKDDSDLNGFLNVDSADSIPANTQYVIGLTAGWGGDPATLAGTVVAWQDDGLNNEACAVTNGDAVQNGAAITGNIALINRGSCSFVEKVTAAEAAGATGVIIRNATGTGVITMGGDPGPTIPAVMVSGPDGDEILGDAGPVVVSIALQPASYNASGFTSRGPRAYDGETIILKPDISAPGDSIVSASSGTGFDSSVKGGTSMAAPHVAGAYALIRQLNPMWDPYMIKANLMNTANNNIVNIEDVEYGATRGGAGGMDVGSAAQNRVIAFSANRRDQVSVSFGMVEIVNTASAFREITIYNSDPTSAATYTVSIDEFVSVPGVTFALLDSSANPATTVTVPANGGTATIFLTMEADASLMPTHQAEPNQNFTGVIVPNSRQYLSEASGAVIFTATSEAEYVDQDLRVPYLALPRNASDMAATESLIGITPDVDDAGSFDINLAGTGIGSDFGFGDGNNASLVSAFELGTYDGCGDGFLFSYDAWWVEDYLDIYATGVTYVDGLVSFAISTCGNWTNLWNNDFSVLIDTDFDQAADLILFNEDISWFLQPVISDEIFVFNEIVGVGFNAYFPPNILNPIENPTYALDNNVMFFAAPDIDFLDAGMDPVNGDFQYRIETAFWAGSAVDSAPNFGWNYYSIPDAAYDLSNKDETSDLAGLNVFHDTDGAIIPVDYDLTAAGDAPDILLLHHHNAGWDTRPEIIEVNVEQMAVESEPFDFEVLGALDAAPVTPTFNFTHNASTVDPSAPGEWYRLVVWNSDDFNIEGDDWFEAAAICEGDGECSIDTGPFSDGFSGAILPFGLAAGDYSWGVQWWSAASGVSDFTTADADFTVTSTAPAAPTITTPEDGATIAGNEVYIEAATDGTQVWVNYDISGPQNENLWEQCAYGTVCGESFDLYADGNYTVVVTVWNPDAGAGVESDPIDFTLANATAEEVVQVSPEDESTVTDALYTFEWETQEGVEWYNLVVVNTDTNSVAFNEWYRCFFGCATTSVYLVNGNYDWYVAGYSNEGGVGPYNTAPFSFTLDVAAPGEVNLLTPVNNTTYGREDLTFSFEDNGASWYEIYIGNPISGDIVFYEWVRRDEIIDFSFSFDDAPLCTNVLDGEDSPICEYDLLVPEGDWQVWMRSWNSGGLGPWNTLGNELHFSIDMS